ncbi:MAG: cupin domain-containing protein [Clostridia bacterium]|nr:cupin domain-containing protein [Clostridia bacterium]
MNSYQKVSVKEEARVELHDALALTGAEVSINTLPAGASVPFVHSHKQNEEIYAVLSGEGYMVIDGEKIGLKSGDWLRVSPSAKRQFFASAESAVKYICIQVKENSLEGYTMTDAVV